MSRILRCLLCLLVICCLVINLSPIKTDATAAAVAIAGASTVAVPAAVAVGAALIALGIMAGTNDDFQRVVGNAVDSLGEWVKDGTVELIQTVDTLGKKAYYVASDAMESIRSWAVTESIVNVPITAYSHSITYSNNKFWSGSATVTSSRPFNIIGIWRTGYDYYAGYEIFAYCNYMVIISI